MIRNVYLAAAFVMVIMMRCNYTEAAPTTNGPTGLIDMPTSDVVRTNQLELGYYNLNNEKFEVFALPLAKNIEVSGSVRYKDQAHRLETINAKYNIRQEGILKPGLAIGVDIPNNDAKSIYAVSSKALPFGLRLNAGIGTHRYKDGFVGLETRLIPLSRGGEFPDMSLMVEHIDKKTSYGIRMATARGLQISAGWRDRKPFWGITYTVP